MNPGGGRGRNAKSIIGVEEQLEKKEKKTPRPLWM
jgi:hypothetical protein